MGTFETKTHLTRLLDRVAAGEGNTITRHDTPTARLVPVKPPSSRQIIKDLIDDRSPMNGSVTDASAALAAPHGIWKSPTLLPSASATGALPRRAQANSSQ